MSDVFAYLRWRFFIGLAMMAISALAMSMTSKTASWQTDRPGDAEAEQARQMEKEYRAEREIRAAKQTDGYDPSAPYTVRDGYQADEDGRAAYDNSEP